MSITITESITAPSKPTSALHAPLLFWLGFVLVVLKALGYTTMPWWAVTLVFWAPIAVVVLLGVLMLVVALLAVGALAMLTLASVVLDKVTTWRNRRQRVVVGTLRSGTRHTRSLAS